MLVDFRGSAPETEFRDLPVYKETNANTSRKPLPTPHTQISPKYSSTILPNYTNALVLPMVPLVLLLLVIVQRSAHVHTYAFDQRFQFLPPTQFFLYHFLLQWSVSTPTLPYECSRHRLGRVKILMAEMCLPM